MRHAVVCRVDCACAPLLKSAAGSFVLPKLLEAVNSLPKLVIHEGTSCYSGCTNISFTCDDVGANFVLSRSIVNPRAVGIHTMTWTVSDKGNTGFYDDSGLAPPQEASGDITFDVFLPVVSPDPNRYVSISNGSDTEDCGLKSNPCRTLSRAIAGSAHFSAILTNHSFVASQQLDRWLVEAGVYVGPLNRMNMGGKMVTFVAASGPGSVIIDCNGTGFAVLMLSTETIETVIDGFVFTNCQGDDNFSSTQNPPLPAGAGGAVVFAGAARGLLKNCIIRLNSARVAGGGVLVHTTNATAGTGPTLTNTTLERNTAMLGAAVSVSAGTITLNNCRFQVLVICTSCCYANIALYVIATVQYGQS